MAWLRLSVIAAYESMSVPSKSKTTARRVTRLEGSGMRPCHKRIASSPGRQVCAKASAISGRENRDEREIGPVAQMARRQRQTCRSSKRRGMNCRRCDSAGPHSLSIATACLLAPRRRPIAVSTPLRIGTFAIRKSGVATSSKQPKDPRRRCSGDPNPIRRAPTASVGPAGHPAWPRMRSDRHSQAAPRRSRTTSGTTTWGFKSSR
jgi:hypothetical protein